MSPVRDDDGLRARIVAILVALAITVLTIPLGMVAAMGQDACTSSSESFGCSGTGGHLLVSPALVGPYVFVGLLILVALSIMLPPRAWWWAYWVVFGVQLLAVLGAFIAGSAM